MSSGGYDAEAATKVLTAVLSEPGGSMTALTQLGTVSAFTFRPGRPGGLLRRAMPDALLVGDWEFHVTPPPVTRVPVRHVVRGIAVQTSDLPPAEAAQILAREAYRVAAESGPEPRQRLDAVIYGLAGIAG